MFYTANLYGQFNSFTFSDSLQLVYQQVDLGNFDDADRLLISYDTTKWTSFSQDRPDFYFTRGYFNLFSSGEMASLGDFVRAGKIYSKIGAHRRALLSEVFITVDLYVKTQWVEAKKRAYALLEKLPTQETEMRAFLYNILSASFCGSPPNLKEGHKYGNLAIAYFKQHNNHRRLISLYGIMAACLSGSENFTVRVQYIDSAMHQASIINHEKQLAFLHIRKSNLFRDQGKLQTALDELQKAEDYFIQHPTEQGQLDWILTIKSQIFAEDDNFKEAYEILESNRIRATNKRSSDIDSQINQLMIKYETAQKQHQIDIQRLEIKNQNQRIQNQLLLGGGVLLLLLTIFGFTFYNNRQRQVKRQREAELRHQRRLLESTVATIEAERKRISQDLHDGVGQKLTGLKMAWEQLLEMLPVDASRKLSGISHILEDANTEVRNVSHQLMPASLRKLGLVPAMEDCLDQSLSSSNISFEFDHVGVDQRFDENIEVGLFRVFQELINNTVKHAEASHINVNLYKNQSQLILMMQDDGKGFDFESLRNTGNGLYNIESRIKSLDGFMEFERRQGKGMQITVRLPIENM